MGSVEGEVLKPGSIVRMKTSSKLRDHAQGVVIWRETTQYAKPMAPLVKVGVRWVGADGGPEKVVDHYPHELEVVV